ncbi:uncharacterized protein LOC142357633 [Convolutriloba macropyga]|uniref:uncharacterized protein LOC142357633 n=1 Tax=Convolutriloba macropyga TaxID=536237 RepID=UPI003F523870
MNFSSALFLTLLIADLCSAAIIRDHIEHDEAQISKRGCRILLSPCTTDEQCCSRYKCGDPHLGVGGGNLCIVKGPEDYNTNNSGFKLLAYPNNDFNGDSKQMA